MPGRRILIVYGSSYGQTAKIARYVADVLTAANDSVTLLNAAELPRSGELPHRRTPRDFDGVVVGASITYGRHQRSARRFIRANRDSLNAIPSALFSVSGAAASPEAEARARARRYVDDLLRETGWRPGLTETVAGAMAYTKYSPLLRWITRRTSAKEGGPTDSSRDHEFTDWAQVGRFARAFARMVPARAAEHAPVPA